VIDDPEEGMMKKTLTASLLSLLLFGSLGNLVLADGMVLPETLSPDYLVVQYHRVTVDIGDGHAVTHVEQAFHNPHPFPVAGRYLFPVPPEAMLSRFEATVDGKQQLAERQDAATTNAILYGAVKERRDPSLLQYADLESLAFDLNLPPGSTRRMSLEYEQVLTPSGGLYHYRYILSVERYTSQPLEEVSMTVNLRSSSSLASVYSSSHDVTVERLGPGEARVTWAAENVRPDKDFDLFFAPADEGFGGGLLTGRRHGHDHFLFLFSPAVESYQENVLPKDIVFVFDRSGSMSGEKIEQAQSAFQFILGQLGDRDRFSIVSFDHRLSSLSRALLPVDRQSLADAREFVAELSADGNTDLERALQAGLGILERSEGRDAPRLIVFMTDGLPTAGVTDGAAITRLVAEANAGLEARLHVFGVGYDVNTHLLDRLAEENGGSVTYVQPGENLEAILTGFYEKIAYPVLTDVEIDFQGMEASDLYPAAIPDLFRGSSVLLAGRYRATDDQVTVRVRGYVGGERRTYIYTYDLDRLRDRDFVPRLWATRRVGALLDRVRVEGASQALVDEIRELGLGYGLVTPYTTFAIESQADGPASADNNSLYGRSDLNQVWGEATVRARVQNQAYQQAAQVSLASGANVTNQGKHSLAQVGGQHVDLGLLQGRDNLDEQISEQWIDQNVVLDRTIVFGSEAYFALADDPEARAFLQSGRNVVFAYKGEVIAVEDPEYDASAPDSVVQVSEPSGSPSGAIRDQSGASDAAWRHRVVVAVLLAIATMVLQILQ
jgi:Ca-activated chloride channel family protein